MKYSEEIQKYLTERDGSTRDITFTPTSFENLIKFLENFISKFQEVSISDNDGNEIKPNILELKEALLVPSGYIHGILKSEKMMVSSFHLFIDWHKSNEYAIDLSYFPGDINLKVFELNTFMKVIKDWWIILNSTEIFIRYENASWDWYDKNGLGVFYYERIENINE